MTIIFRAFDIKKATANIKKATAIAVAFLLLHLPLSIALAGTESLAKQKTSRVHVTLANEVGIPLEEAMDDFDCSDKIYAVVELNDYPKGRHELSVLWIDPASTSRENTQYPFHVINQNTKLWAWLSLSRARGAGMLQWLNPAAGLEEFIGPWTIQVRIDNKKISELKFEVSC